MNTILIKKQSGIALIISLIMLLLMTILAVSSMESTILEEKMAGNYKDRNLAFQSAEAGLRAGEVYLRDTAVLPVFNDAGSSAGLYTPTSAGNSRWDIINWSDGSKVKTYSGSLADVDAPLYIIEELQPVNDTGGSLEAGVSLESRYYRITTRATGGTSNSVVILQSNYKR